MVAGHLRLGDERLPLYEAKPETLRNISRMIVDITWSIACAAERSGNLHLIDFVVPQLYAEQWKSCHHKI
jgi:hypothetical protein